MDPILGQIQLFSFFFAPQGWMSCEGQILNVQNYTALYSLIGNAYGGSGQTTFALPNLNGAAPLPNMKYYIAIEGIYPSRS
ncbi:MAG TPA: tail fiber protein [Bacteroidales bacterium]|nr:tail fiber protein [Bacteroidales bacterium]HPS16681.1 tail fiber protein [Bacteroidales bacterium]